MDFWRKKRNEIPPVVPASNLPSATSARSLPYTYPNTSIASARRDDTPNKSDIGPYNRKTGAGDVYSRGTAKLDEDRDALFSGYNPKKSGSSRFFDGPGFDEEGDEDEDEEKIHKQIRFVKQESVNSSRNALLAALRARETGLATLSKLSEQGERLAGTDHLLGEAEVHAKDAAANAKAIKSLNGTIFLPSFYKERKKKYGVPEEASYEERKVPRYNFDDPLGDDPLRTTTDLEQASDDELEGELDGNLDQIGKAAGLLKQIATAMGDELDVQNKVIDHLAVKADRLNVDLEMTTDRFKKIK